MKSRSVLFFIAITLLLKCNIPKDDVSLAKEIDCEEIGFVNVSDWRKEIMFIDSLKLNGKYNVINEIEVFAKVLGKPLREYVIDEEISIYSKSETEKKRVIYKDIVIDRIGKKAIINTIDLRQNAYYITSPKITLRGGMPVSEVCQIYPRSCRLIQTGGNVWTGYIELRGHDSGIDMRRIFLVFYGEKLVKFKILDLS
jgi:hypothetical protein